MKPSLISPARRLLARGCASAFDSLSRFTGRRKAAACALMALAGTLVAMAGGVPKAVWIILSAALALFALCFRKRGKRFSAVCLLLAVAFAFSGYTAFRDERPVFEIGKKADVTGTVCTRPVYQPDKNRTTVYLTDVSLDGDAFSDNVYVYLYSDEETQIEYGQTLFLPGAGVWKPDGATNPNGFDFAAFLWRKGVSLCASISASDGVVVSEKASFTRALYRFSDFLSEKVRILYPENADVMCALLLSDRTALSDEVYESFQETGVAHLVALSGMHVSCVAMFIEAVLMLFMIPSRVRGVITVVILYVYAAMMGAGVSVMRAVWMYALFVAARLFGYPSDLLTRLSIAFLIQMLINPLSILDTGMQLSYLSVLSLALVTRPVRSLLPAWKHFTTHAARAFGRVYSGAADALSASLAVQLGTLPSVSALFHSVPVLSIPINLIVVPLGLITVYFGMASLILYFINPSLGALLAFLPDAIWTFIKFVTSKAALIPGAILNARAWLLPIIILYYVLMALVSGYFVRGERSKKLLVCLIILFAAAVTLLPPLPHRGLDIVFLDAGYADSCVIRAENSCYVVDCGKDNGITADYLTSIGARVEGVFLTHPDIDHAGGAGEVLKRYPNAKVYVSECWHRMDVRDTVAGSLWGKELIYLSQGDTVTLADGMTAEVVWPRKGYQPASDNDGSLVLRVVYKEASALLTGDITSDEDRNITAESDVLKVAHHGSKNATSKELLAGVTPKIAVISVSGNGYGHPTEEVLSRLEAVGAAVYRTDECGAITVNMQPDGEMKVTTVLPAGG